MLMTEQVDKYFLDLKNPDMKSGLALVHSRFSTNTFPSWARSHPYRYIAHNGEINTLRGNINWMRAREALFQSDAFGDDIQKILPIVDPDGSDSAMFDNVLELLVLAGRSLPHAMMMMIPEPWANHESMSDEKKAFYEYHSCLMEPWDGPACVAFTDGVRIGASLDRNGLRPSRYYVTKDDQVIMASEVGVLDIAPENIAQKGRLQPGRMFYIDTALGRIVDDAEINEQIASEQPYRQWLNQHLIELSSLPDPEHLPEPGHSTVLQRQQAFGYSFEDLRMLLVPMARDGVEAIGSMGTDTPLAVLSNQSQLLYNYFHRLREEPAHPVRGELPPHRAEVAGADQRRTGQAQGHQPVGLQVGHPSDPLQGGQGLQGAREGPERSVQGRFQSDQRRGQHPDLVRPRPQRQERGHPGIAGCQRPPSSLDPRRRPEPRRTGSRIG
jgi:glutamate synthase (ferredoxin)